MFADLVGLALLGWAGFYAGASASASLRASRGALDPKSAAFGSRSERVVVLRPCAGRENDLGDTLRSTGRALGVKGALVIFAVEEEADEATPTARTIARELTAEGLETRVVVTRAFGPNRKAAQLARALADVPAPRDLVVVVDSDVDLTGVDLDALVAPIGSPSEVAASWMPPVEDADRGTVADRVSGAVLGASLHSFPLLAAIDATTMVGKTFAVRRATLDAVGGFGAMRWVLGEDLELARRIRALGRRVVAVPRPVRSRAGGRDLAQVTARFARWLSVLRGQRPLLLLSYPFLFSAAPLIALLAMLHPSSAAIAAAALALGSRAVTALVACRVGRARIGVGILLWAIVGDGVLLAALARALGSRRLAWRGRSLELGRGGVLREA